MIPNAPQIDVVVVSHEGARHLTTSLSAFTASKGVRVRLIVVDNASADGSALIAEQNGAVVIALPANVGYGAACNAGLAAVEADWVAFANQDVVVEPDSLERMVSRCDDFERRSHRPAVAGPLLLDTEGQPSSTCHRLPSLSRQILGLLISERLAGVRNRSSAPEEQTCGWIDAALIVGRPSTFRSVGGFDARYFMYVEDVDLFARLAAAGASCLWVPSARVTHHGGRRPLAPELHAGALRNWRLFFGSRSGPAAGALVLAAGLVGSVARGLAWRWRAVRKVPLARAWATMFLQGARLVVRPAPIKSEDVP